MAEYSPEYIDETSHILRQIMQHVVLFFLCFARIASGLTSMTGLTQMFPGIRYIACFDATRPAGVCMKTTIVVGV